MRPRTILFALLFLGTGAPPALADQGKNHRVRPGESLFSIAEAAYGNGLEWSRIWEANSWLDPDNLRAGEIVWIPPRDPSWGEPPSRENYALNPGSGDFEGEPQSGRGRRSANPGSGTPGLSVFKNLATHVSSGTVFGLRVEKVVLFLFLAFLIHACLQGVLLWLAANITFVKDASFKKSLKATLCAEMLTFSTLVVLGGVAAVMLYLGAEPGPGGLASAPLFPTFEEYLRSPAGMAVAGFALLALFVILNLRFLPQVFGVPMGRAMTLVAFSILIPHLVGFYLIGQRTGMIHG
jgi:hypothetical protein